MPLLQGTCQACGNLVQSARGDSRYCSPACRQKAYRDRQKRGEPAVRSSPPEEALVVTYLDEVGGVLHYRGVPIVAIAELLKPWRANGNRYVLAWTGEPAWKLSAVRKELCERHYWRNGRGQLFECLQCRRWAIGRAWVFCSHQCRRAYRARQARERRRK
jgi:hypothetical protein